LRREPRRGAVEIGLASELKAERVDFCYTGLPQHDRVMVALLDAAQIERIRLPGGFQEPQAVHVERACAVEIAHAERDVACPHHVERGFQVGLTNRHGVGTASGPGEYRCFCPFAVPPSFAVDFQISVYMATRVRRLAPPNLPRMWGG
jgi:hypothetical protein